MPFHSITGTSTVPAVDRFVTSPNPLEQVHEAFAEASNPEGIKVAIKPNG